MVTVIGVHMTQLMRAECGREKQVSAAGLVKMGWLGQCQ